MRLPRKLNKGCRTLNGNPRTKWQRKGRLHIAKTFADVVEMARLYIMTDCGGSFERFSEWGLIRPKDE